MNVMSIVNAYGNLIEPKHDMSTSQAKEIIKNSNSNMELAGNSYVLGFFNGARFSQKGKINVPALNIKMMSDDEWNRLAARQRVGGVTG